ncbi:MAG: magnetosome biogenesis CDF transporter MamM, partial [Zetaproteobacteria bacterium]|nr:magnetosome biogenesis CDF transporter MamM [Zetaproteobacteria bacterium]
MKVFVGLISGSQALVADGMYSAKDLMTSILVIVGMKVSDKPIDKDHPYGHGKVEFVLALVASVVFLSLTAYLLIHAVYLLFNADEHRAPHIIALWAALISVAVNVFMYFYSRCVSVESNSPMIRTLSRHHHADATASLAVAFAIIGAHYLDMPWIDLAVAMFEALHLLYLGSDVFRDACRGLMDRSMDVKIQERIIRIVKGLDHVKEVKEFRARHIGQSLFLEVTIGVDPALTVAEANEVRKRVRDEVFNIVPHIGELHVVAQAASDAVPA